MYLSGIEIAWQAGETLTTADSKLYLSGIEMLIEGALCKGREASKLYLSGIEIRVRDEHGQLQLSPNCTLVELKSPQRARRYS